MYVASRVEVHKGRESSNSFGGFQGSPKPQPVPLKKDPTDPLGLCYTSRFVGLTTASVRTQSFRTSRP